MVEERSSRPLVALCDIDGTQNRLPFLPFPSPPPLKTLFNLIRKRFRVPEVGEELKPAKPRGLFRRKLDQLWHTFRPFTKDSQLGLDHLQELVEEAKFGGGDIPLREIRLGILSGRVPDLHELTHQQLRGSGRLGPGCYFREEDVYLSSGASSSGFKEHQGVQILAGPGSVGALVLFEDDLAAAMRFARLQARYPDQRVLVFLLQNISNHPWLLKRAGVRLPQNVISVSSFQEGARDLAARIRASQI